MWWRTATTAAWCCTGINRAIVRSPASIKAKFWVVADAIRLNRTDTALVRVIVPISNGDSASAQRSAVDFVQKSYHTIRGFLPS